MKYSIYSAMNRSRVDNVAILQDNGINIDPGEIYDIDLFSNLLSGNSLFVNNNISLPTFAMNVENKMKISFTNSMAEDGK